MNSWKRMDKLLLSLKEKGFCQPDAPKEIIVISEEPLEHKTYKNEILRKLYDPNKINEKIKHKLIVNDREVEIIKNPILDGRLEVVVKKEPKNTLLTFSEVYDIIEKLQKILGINLHWKRPFPRGSC